MGVCRAGLGPARPLKGTGRKGSRGHGSGQEVAFCASGLCLQWLGLCFLLQELETHCFSVRPSTLGSRAKDLEQQGGEPLQNILGDTGVEALRSGFHVYVTCGSEWEGGGPYANDGSRFLPRHEKGVHRAGHLDGLHVVPGMGFSVSVSGEQGKFSMNN